MSYIFDRLLIVVYFKKYQNRAWAIWVGPDTFFLTVNSHLSGLIMVKGMNTDRSGHSSVLATLMMITVFYIMLKIKYF